VMLLGGGSSCQQCGCAGNPCPECRHYTIGTWKDSVTATVTINGVSVPVITGDEFPEEYWVYLDVPSTIISNCSQPPNMAYRAAFVAEFESYWWTYTEVSGCATAQIYLWIHVYLPDSGFYNDRLRRFIPTYTIGLNCSDVGGTAVPATTWTTADSISVPEECLIPLLEWLNTLTVVTTFAFEPCVCPP
jgi:hypothetical protein